MDVFPTVLALAGLDVPGNLYGHSLVPLMFGVTPEHPVYAALRVDDAERAGHGWSPLLCPRSPRYKFRAGAAAPSCTGPRRPIPDESHNIIREQQEVARRMSGELTWLYGRHQPRCARPRGGKPRLRDLAAARVTWLRWRRIPAVSKPATRSGTLADPKDRLAAFVEVQRAGELMGTDEYGPAIEALEAALKEDPSMPQARVMLVLAIRRWAGPPMRGISSTAS